MKLESVLITGTTSGVGKALLELYAKAGVKVIAVNRRRVPELESGYPRVRFECLDVRAAGEVEGLLDELARSSQLPDAFILNAGVNQVDNDESFELASYRAVVETNLFGVLNFVQPLTKMPPGRAPRHVIAICSMANYVGNPYGLGYTTSKRALTSCFEAWSAMYAATDLVFQRVMLGPVRTPMYAMHDSFPPWMVRVKNLFSASVEGTARAVAGLAKSDRKRLFYPWHSVPLYLGMWVLRALVPGFFRGRRTLAGKARRAALASDTASDR
jgi:NAD(P)-dependent dehydrogenase (short-subunit alcohol dehydrogenase family)